MPMQLWLTFDELGSLLDCDPEQARHHVYANQWERRRASDGITRALLPFASAREFMLVFAAQDTNGGATAADDPRAGADCMPLKHREVRRVKGRRREEADAFNLAL